MAKHCYYRKDKSEQGESNGKIRKNNTSKKVNLASEEKPDYSTFHEFNVNVCPELNQYEWIIDSGCTSHMTFNKKYFINYKPIKGRVHLAGRDRI